MNAGFKVEYKSLLTGNWVSSHLGPFSTEARANNAAKKELPNYETRVINSALAAAGAA